ncbi:helix-turn-helix domain-containing protein [Frankia sp. QA3]|uniref:helix-turn-helix domain-containing protein n=1 Tax=Frankia sp. QA3 TaxID=710111 RepID=UPI0018DEE11B|nr:helix-turn-helix domain-containing protein [Frankia sp. QA3]
MAEFARRITELRGSRSVRGFAKDARVDRADLTRVEQGELLPSERMAARLDSYCATGDELSRWRRRIHAMRTGLPVPPTDEEVGPTDRREFGLLGAAAAAAQISGRIAAAAAIAPPTLREIEADINEIAGAYMTTPAMVLAERAERGWRSTEQMLDGRVRGRTRTVLDLRAGQYSIYLALTANDLGEQAASDTYLDLAGQHAQEAGDRLLSDCVAAVDSSFEYFRNNPHRAQAVAAERRRNAHPYARPMLAACESRAAARGGDEIGARVALDDVWSHVWAGPVLPGEVQVDEDQALAQTAAILSTLEDPASEKFARRAVEAHRAAGRATNLGGSYNALARSYLCRAEPDPERAAAATRSALEAVGDQRTSWVVGPAAQTWRRLDTRWGSLPAVRDLGELVAAAQRPALPAGADV